MIAQMFDGSNSTARALASGAEFVGDWVNVDSWGGVNTTVKADSTGLLRMEFSQDSKAADSTLSYAIGTFNEVHSLKVTSRFFRIRYTNNSGSDQSYLRITSLLNRRHSPLAAPRNLPLGQDADATVTRVIPMELDIARNLFSEYIKSNKLGKNSDVDTSVSTDSPEFVTEQGGFYTAFTVMTAEPLEAVSTSADDTAAGSGAQKIMVAGALDADYNSLPSFEITLNGTSPSAPTTLSYLRAHTMWVETSGSDFTANAGTITVRGANSGTVFLTILPGRGQSNYCVFTVPAGHTTYMVQVFAQVRRSSAAAVDGSFWLRSPGKAPRFRRPFSFSHGGSLIQRPFGYIGFSEKTDFAPVITAASANNIRVTFGMDLLTIKNT